MIALTVRRFTSFTLLFSFLAGCDDTHSSSNGDSGPDGSSVVVGSGGTHSPSGSGSDASAGRASTGGAPSTDAGKTSHRGPDAATPPAPSTDAATTPPPVRDAGATPPDASPDGSATRQAITELVRGDVSIVGLTTDGWVVYRDGDALRAAHLSAPYELKDVAAKAGSVVIRGKVVFNWANVDWMANVGDLSIWTANAGAHVVGSTQYVEGLVAASEAGDTMAYTTNLKPTTMDVVIAPSDFSASQAVLKAVGRGSNTTCTPTMGFVGARFFVGSCAAGARAGTIQRFDHGATGWQSTTIATSALPVWSADATGDKVFFQSQSYAGQYVEGGQTHLVDNGVSSGVILPDGSAVLYTVGDQLRRTSLSSINPITIVTTGYSQPVGFSPSYHLALYSTKVTYTSGTQRDLRLTTTEAFNAKPTELVAQPLATLARSTLTADEKFVLYLTDVTPTGGNLHVVGVDGTERVVLPGVVEAAATRGGSIVFTNHSSDPNRYPVVADLELLDLNATVTPELLEAKVIDGKSFQVDASGTRVVYVQSGIVGDAGPIRTSGLFVQTLH